jgi:hypothetical protein
MLWHEIILKASVNWPEGSRRFMLWHEIILKASVNWPEGSRRLHFNIKLLRCPKHFPGQTILFNQCFVLLIVFHKYYIFCVHKNHAPF